MEASKANDLRILSGLASNLLVPNDFFHGLKWGVQQVYKMDMVDLGGLTLKESSVANVESRKACQDYGRETINKLS